MVFDTTASNTGSKTAACISLQQKVGHPLLWTACRHHIGELIISHVWKGLKIEESSGPEVSLFKKFQSWFSQLQASANGHTISATQLKLKVEVVQALRHHLESGFVRDDYKEFLELCLVYATGTVGEVKSFTFKYPGALHNARWMAKVIYSLKMVLLKKNILSELPENAVFTGPHQLEKLVRFCDFIVSSYVRWWITATNPVKAPSSDLRFSQDILNYEKSDPFLSQVALRAMKNHLWYLTEDLVPLALFDEEVPPADRQKLAHNITAFEKMELPQKRIGTGFGKPVFPGIHTVLDDLAGPDSWLFFSLLRIDPSFLYRPVESWAELSAYQNGLRAAKYLKVVNDVAERAVKLASDFLPWARTEAKYQDILLTVHQERKVLRNQRSSRSKSVG